MARLVCSDIAREIITQQASENWGIFWAINLTSSLIESSMVNSTIYLNEERGQPRRWRSYYGQTLIAHPFSWHAVWSITGLFVEARKEIPAELSCSQRPRANGWSRIHTQVCPMAKPWAFLPLHLLYPLFFNFFLSLSLCCLSGIYCPQPFYILHCWLLPSSLRTATPSVWWYSRPSCSPGSFLISFPSELLQQKLRKALLASERVKY